MTRPESDRIGPYILEAKLARGGFGHIWQAHHEDSEEQVAVKILHPELVVSDAIVMRFEREARAIAMLRHPNVVHLLEFGEHDNRPYIVMELLNGPNLEGYVKSHGAMPPQRVLFMLEQLCSALSAAHDRGIIHRDLKASNVVISEENGTQRVVLLDFGIVKLIEGEGPELTASRVALGSPVCMAPEQIQGNPVDRRTDVYALGSLTFLMLTGELPFPGRAMDTMHQHLVAARPRPSDRIDISPTYDDIVVKAMARKPRERYATVAQFLEAFRSAMQTDEAGPIPALMPESLQYDGDESTLCIGLYVDVSVDQDELEDADDQLLDDMDAIYPRAARFLERRGFMLAYENGDSALFVLPLPPREQDQRQTRERILQYAEQLAKELDERRGRDARIRVSLHLHVDEASLVQGLVTEGPLLDITSWVQSGASEGLRATAAMLRDLRS